MPSISKLLLLSTLLLSGALSLPVAEPGFIIGKPGLTLHRGSRREASPGNIGIGGRPGFSLTRGSKREAEAEARNTLETIAISPQDFKREAEPEPGNGFHTGGSFVGGLSRGSKREAEAEPEAAPGGFHGGGASRGHKREAEPEAAPGGFHGGGASRGHKREANPEAAPGGFHGGGISRGHKREASPEPGNGFHYGGSFTGGLTRGSKRQESAPVDASDSRAGAEDSDLDYDFSDDEDVDSDVEVREVEAREEAGEPYELVPIESVEKREAEPGNGFHFGGSFTGGLTRGH